MIKTLTNMDKMPITGKDDFDERLTALLDDGWTILHFNTFGDYKRTDECGSPEGRQPKTEYVQMTTNHITKIAVLQK